MLEKKDLPYAVTTLTQYGKHVLLSTTSTFDITHFVLIDDEVNYNLFNKQQKISFGFDRLEQTLPDYEDDIFAQTVFEPSYKVEEQRSYLFGNIVPHQLRSDQIKTETDLQVDMTTDYIVELSEIKNANAQRSIDFDFELVSGNYSNFTLQTSDFIIWKTNVDLRARITIYDDQGNGTKLSEDSNYISDIQYNVLFQGLDINKSFSYSLKVDPNTVLSLDGKNIIATYGNYEFYGTFHITKQFTYNGKVYISNALLVNINQPIKVAPIVLNGNDSILQQYSFPYVKKNVFVTFDYHDALVAPTIQNIYINDVVAKQTVNFGYYQINRNPMPFTIKSSNINSLHIKLKHVVTGRTESLITLTSTDLGLGNFLTIPTLVLNFVLRTQISLDGSLNFVVNPSFQQSFGLIEMANNGMSVNNTYEYDFKTDISKKIYISVNSPIFIASSSDYGFNMEADKLWQIYIEDHNALFNFTFNRPILSSDYENVILYT